MVIRRAAPGDIKDLVAMHVLLRDYSGGCNRRVGRNQSERPEHLAKEYEGYLRSDSSAVFVAEQDGQLVGYVAGRVDRHPGWAPQVVGTVLAAFVRRECRRAGVATALIRELLAFFESSGAEDITLRYVIGNRVGESFWRQLGFEPVLCFANTRPAELRQRLRDREGA